MQVYNSCILENLRNLRKKHSLNQEQMGEIIGLSQSQYSKVERGVSPLTACQMLYFCDWFKISPVTFLQGKFKNRRQRLLALSHTCAENPRSPCIACNQHR